MQWHLDLSLVDAFGQMRGELGRFEFDVLAKATYVEQKYVPESLEAQQFQIPPEVSKAHVEEILQSASSEW